MTQQFHFWIFIQDSEQGLLCSLQHDSQWPTGGSHPKKRENKTWAMHTLNGTLLSLFKETQPCATTWVKLEGILLGETSQSQKVAWGLPGQLGQEESVEGCRAPVFQNEGILKICNPSSSVNRLCTTDCTFKMVKVANYMLRAVFRQLKKGFRPTMGFWTRSITPRSLVSPL